MIDLLQSIAIIVLAGTCVVNSVMLYQARAEFRLSQHQLKYWRMTR